MEQPQLNVSVEAFTFPNFRQKSDDVSSAVNTSADIKVSTTIGRNNTTKIDKLINGLNVPPVDSNRKSAMTGQTENLGFAGIQLQS